VLIVDDQQPFREAAHMVMEVARGFAVLGAVETGEDSVATARATACVAGRIPVEASP